MRRFVEPDKSVRYRPYTPTERWVSGLNQQFTKLPIQKVREFESHSFRTMPVWRNLAYASVLEAEQL